jgi:hypothetical protein
VAVLPRSATYAAVAQLMAENDPQAINGRGGYQENESQRGLRAAVAAGNEDNPPIIFNIGFGDDADENVLGVMAETGGQFRRAGETDIAELYQIGFDLLLESYDFNRHGGRSVSPEVDLRHVPTSRSGRRRRLQYAFPLEGAGHRAHDVLFFLLPLFLVAVTLVGAVCGSAVLVYPA